MRLAFIGGGLWVFAAFFTACASNSTQQSSPAIGHPVYVPQGLASSNVPTKKSAAMVEGDIPDKPIEKIADEEDRFEENGPGVQRLVYAFPEGWQSGEGRYYGGLATVHLRRASNRITAVLYPTVNEEQVDRACSRFREMFEVEGVPVPETLVAGESPQIIRSDGAKTWMVCRRTLPGYPSYTLAVVGTGPRNSPVDRSTAKFYESLRVEDQ